MSQNVTLVLGLHNRLAALKRQPSVTYTVIFFPEPCAKSASIKKILDKERRTFDLASISRTAGLSRAEAVFERCR